jgi:hypothetical protein
VEQNEDQALQALRAELDLIKTRLARVERSLGLADAAAAADPGGEAVSREALVGAGQPWLVILAWACFVLCGALLLRAATHHGWLPARHGLGAGIAYGLALVVVPHLVARGSPISRTLQLCATLLIPLMVLETAHRSGGMSASTAVVLLALAASVELLIGSRQQQAALIALALVSTTVADAVLPLQAEGAAARAALAVGLGALALWAGRIPGRGWLRPLIVPPLMAIIGVAVLVIAERPGHPRHVGLVLFAAAASLAILLVAVALTRREPDRFDRAIAPAAALWLAGLGLFTLPGASRVVGCSAGLALLALSRWLPQPRARIARASGAVLLGALLAGLTIGPPVLAALALWIAWPARPPASDRGGLFLAHGLMVIALAGALVELIAAGRAARPLVLATCCGLVGLCLAHAVLLGQPRGERQAVPPLAALSLAGTLLCALIARSAAAQHVGPVAAELAATFTVALVATLCSLARGRLAGAVLVAFVALAVLAGKVLLWDLPRLDGVYVVVVVMTLGLTALAVALSRRRARPAV